MYELVIAAYTSAFALMPNGLRSLQTPPSMSYSITNVATFDSLALCQVAASQFAGTNAVELTISIQSRCLRLNDKLPSVSLQK